MDVACPVYRVLQKSQSEAESRNLLQEILHEPVSCSIQSLVGSVRLDWVRHWDDDAQKSVLLSRLPDHCELYELMLPPDNLLHYLSSSNRAFRRECIIYLGTKSQKALLLQVQFGQ